LRVNPLITLDSISVRLYDKLYLQNTSWQIRDNEQWAILGPNGSGKTTLARALFGAVPVVRGRVIHHTLPNSRYCPSSDWESIGYVSPELLRDLSEREELQASFRDFSGKMHEITTVKDVILRDMKRNSFSEPGYGERLTAVACRMGIEALLDRDINSVSTGEMRKAMISRALMKGPRLLILDEPFDGLDEKSRRSLADNINDLTRCNVNLVLITHRYEEIVPNITHVLYMEGGKICVSGRKEHILRHEVMSHPNESEDGTIADLFQNTSGTVLLYEEDASQKLRTDVLNDGHILIEMKDVTIRYGDTIVLDSFNWRVRRDENWAILGPNGAGKSTVLRMITGDNLQSYSNDVFLFGKKKGSGESIWEIKKKIGIVSPELQFQYRKDIKAIDVVCSGFHDSIGLYRSCSVEQKETASKWIKMLAIENLTDHSFEQLSYGQRQLILIARAMVKSPVLLILDEPCDGLDMDNRTRLLEITEYIGRHTDTNLIYVTLHENEVLPCITHRLKLDRGKITETKCPFS